MKSLIASEACAIGHPDKVADQISDAILDAYLARDPQARVDISCMLSHDTVMLAGEITSHAKVPVTDIAKNVLDEIGYTGFGFVTNIVQQSADIAHAIMSTGKLGAGDQGIMVGYATQETEEYMPLSWVLANKLMHKLPNGYGPDGKALVGVIYDDIEPKSIAFIVLSCQHKSDVSLFQLHKEIHHHIIKAIPEKLLQADTKILINPGGAFINAGPGADTGITGRKVIVDTYGGAVAHGGGAFSGKDPTKVDRSGSYVARYIAKNIVASSLAKRCEVTLYYAIGMPEPVALSINTFGTSKIDSSDLEEAVRTHFDLSVSGIITHLKLDRPIYRQTAWGGHFGRANFPWEALDKVEELRKLCPN